MLIAVNVNTLRSLQLYPSMTSGFVCTANTYIPKQ